MKSKVLYVHSWEGTIHKPFNAIRNPLSVWAQPTVAPQQRAYEIKNIFWALTEPHTEYYCEITFIETAEVETHTWSAAVVIYFYVYQAEKMVLMCRAVHCSMS